MYRDPEGRMSKRNYDFMCDDETILFLLYEVT